MNKTKNIFHKKSGILTYRLNSVTFIISTYKKNLPENKYKKLNIFANKRKAIF